MKVNIVCYSDIEDNKVEAFIKKYSLSYDASYNREEDYHEWEGIEMNEKLYTMLLLLGGNWHIEKSDGAVGEQ